MIPPPWYYRRVRRILVVIAVVMLAASCGKRVPAAPNAQPSAGASVRASELLGLASYYAEPYHGRKTANGEVFDSYQELTAAHRTLPFNTVVKVTNQQNGKDVEVRINDRGPFVEGRVIDLSLKAAREIDMVQSGVAPVKLAILKEGPPKVAARSTNPVSPAVAASSSGSFTVQVGAFESREVAESLKKNLEQRHSDVTIEAFSTTRTFYRVRVGRLTDMVSAEQLLKKLREENFDPFVVRLN